MSKKGYQNETFEDDYYPALLIIGCLALVVAIFLFFMVGGSPTPPLECYQIPQGYDIVDVLSGKHTVFILANEYQVMYIPQTDLVAECVR